MSLTRVLTASSSANQSKNGEDSKMSLVDQSWELIDPCPDVHALFIQYNDTFFFGALAGCEVRWSPRMTLCAGQCHYEGHGGLCSIRLSKPLLKLRPRKDLVETLLHEMIHAYLFVTQNNRDREGHGPEFQSHMQRINHTAGTKISIYHSFHDEVAVYKQHWWRCNGSCRERRPYYGWVKRASNRAPGPNDLWWSQHQQTCGGSYLKVKEPEGYVDKKQVRKEKLMQKQQGATSSTTTSTSSGAKTKAKLPARPPASKPGMFNMVGTTSSSSSSSSQTRLDKFMGIGASASSAQSSSSNGLSSTSMFSTTTSSNNNNNNNTDIAVITLPAGEEPTVACPVCSTQIAPTKINDHLDFCVEF